MSIKNTESFAYTSGRYDYYTETKVYHDFHTDPLHAMVVRVQYPPEDLIKSVPVLDVDGVSEGSICKCNCGPKNTEIIPSTSSNSNNKYHKGAKTLLWVRTEEKRESESHSIA